ncbi:MAG: alkyl hydroperoxide reductase, partial [Planctomycetaceae bacterium]|nr:alkyl hydroperoxide reductase [Planctomycetaceae bacterium]
EDYPVQAEVEWLPKEGEILSLAPHMHMRGKAFRYTLERAGASEIVLDVPNYDFNWQHVYQLSQPIPISEDLKIHCEARFNNSETNLVNPDPNIAVKWGDQTWQEMMVGFLDVAVDRDANIEMPWSKRVAGTNNENGANEQRRKDAEQFIRRFDADGDGRVSRAEVPTEFAVFAFRNMDHDKDDAITLEEAASEDR